MNVPNFLSIFRIALVPVFVATFLSGMEYAYPIAIGIFIFAGLTDVLDGRIARKYNQITMLGRFLDPFADKLMVFSALICLTIKEMIPLWATVLFFSKELAQFIGTVLFFRKVKDVPPSNLIGKLGTLVFYLTIAVITLFDLTREFRAALLIISFALIFAAFLSYAKRAIDVNRKLKLEKENSAQ